MNQRDVDRMPEEEPLFNIGAVSRMTDIPETTLRAWERRYDFPQSARTAGGHRLYSQHEVIRLQWVKMRIDEGMQTSQAIRALQHVDREKEGLVLPQTARSLPARAEHGEMLAVWQGRLIAALLAHDASQANQVLGEALALFPLEVLILDVIGPTMAEIGEAWSEGRITVADEHFATNHLRHHLLVWMRMGPPTYPVSPVVLACAPNELHEGSLLMLAVLLRRLRWPVLYLGQTVPLSELAPLLAEIRPALIIFVAMTEGPAYDLAEWPRWLPDAAENGRPVVGYGGRIFSEQPEFAERIPGVLLGATIQEGVEHADRLLHEMNPLLR